MFYEERIIYGILHRRSSPDAAFEPFSQRDLTQRVVDLEIKLTRAQHTIEVLEAQ